MAVGSQRRWTISSTSPFPPISESRSYYYDIFDEIRTLDREYTTTFERVRENSLKPNEPVS